MPGARYTAAGKPSTVTVPGMGSGTFPEGNRNTLRKQRGTERAVAKAETEIIIATEHQIKSQYVRCI
jgi:hypothetical protein